MKSYKKNEIPGDQWRFFARYSRFRTNLDDIDYTPNPPWPKIYQDVNSGKMHATNITGDIVYTINPSTILDVKGTYTWMRDSFDAPRQKMTPEDLRNYWDVEWWKPYIFEDTPPDLYFPGVNIDGDWWGKPNWWLQDPHNYAATAKISKQIGRHYLKTGTEFRWLRVEGLSPRTFRFFFNRGLTADTYINPDTKVRGHAWATLLLGGVDNDSLAESIPFGRPSVDFYSLFIQDDFKITPTVTLNLGLRWEYEAPVYDRDLFRLSKPFDPYDPIPEMQANPPAIPQEALALMNQPYQFSGAWSFTSKEDPGIWKAKKLNLMPRLGVAVRLSDNTALRVGYTRFITPPHLQVNILDNFPYPSFSALTTVAPVLQGVPQAVWSDPFPASNPLIPPAEKKFGRYTYLGSDAITDVRDFRPGVNDRFNISFQRGLVHGFVVDATYFINIGRSMPYTKRFNLMDPQLRYTHKTLLTKSVSNPFYNYLTPDLFPGQLRNQRQVSLGDLLKPWPQYGEVSHRNMPGVRERYHAIQLRVQRPFANGFNFLWAYNYNRERQEEFFDDLAEFAGAFRFERSARPRHRMSIAGVYEFPVGRRRRYLTGVSAFVDALLGGWTTSAIYSFSSGDLLRFGQMDVIGDPVLSDTSKWGLMFNPQAFKQSPAFTPRSNPKWFDGVMGPGVKNLDLTLGKFFEVTERFRLEFKMESYNVSNTFTAGNPELSVTRSNFGRTYQQRSGFNGREFQYTLRLHF